ncbi:glucosidase II [Nitzschia inconspicua]|uniref:Glucosidase II n=1 Tax=Nitzschia inconspicua TaxID=303405 RepID=A0A9K3M4J8_9STRA|nr:glucosidase II [Nitzschia inconspicua]
MELTNQILTLVQDLSFGLALWRIQGHRRTSLVFVCPQQPNLKLPLSRLDDGICDCCDGTDEPNGVVSCRDDCEEMLRAERDARAKLQHDFQQGYKKRRSDIEHFQTLRQFKLQQVDELETKLNEEVVPSIEDTQKQKYVKSRVSLVRDCSSVFHELPDKTTG